MSTTAEPKTTVVGAASGARRRIGVGVIGFGWLGQAHTRSLLRIPTLFENRAFDTELVACSDALPARPVFLAFVATTVGALSSFALLAMWVPQWVIDPCR